MGITGLLETVYTHSIHFIFKFFSLLLTQSFNHRCSPSFLKQTGNFVSKGVKFGIFDKVLLAPAPRILNCFPTLYRSFRLAIFFTRFEVCFPSPVIFHPVVIFGVLNIVFIVRRVNAVGLEVELSIFERRKSEVRYLVIGRCCRLEI